MSQREFIALGTASQAPTRDRSHNSYLLRWDGEGFMFDPGEGTQRQLLFADVSACSVHHILITHFHGDHCLGLPGLLQRMSLNGCSQTVDIYYPASGEAHLDRLRGASITSSEIRLVQHPVDDTVPGLHELCRTGTYAMYAHVLEHSAPAIGFRIEEFPRRRFLQSKLDSAGISGPDVGRLAKDGLLQRNGVEISLDEMTTVEEGSVVAFVMDTRPCTGALALARSADLLVMEATYTSADASLAAAYFHSTSKEAAETARDAGARKLALTHFSARYTDAEAHVLEARAIFPETTALRDFDRVPVPRRRQDRPGQGALF
jgi:ribonuclease Z